MCVYVYLYVVVCAMSVRTYK